MSSSQIGRILAPYLDRIIKNSSWRKHSTIISSCKSIIDLLQSSPSSLPEDALRPLVLALESSSPKLAEPALDAFHRLFSLSLLRGEIDDPTIASICACGAAGEESMELGMLRVVVAAVRSTSVLIRGECVVQIVKSCYNVCLGSQSGVNQLCAKIALAQILMIVFARVEAGRADAKVGIVDVSDLADRSLSDSSVVQAGRDFARDAMGGDEVEEKQGECEGGDDGGMSRIREDGFFLFKNLCKFSMKFAAAGENQEDPLLLRGKVLSLELLKMVMENAGTFWLVNER